MKRMLILSCLALALFALCAAGWAEEAPGSLALTRMMGNGINLGNTFEACNNGMSGGNTTDDPSFYETM